MSAIREILRKDNFTARVVTFGMIPLLWRIGIYVGNVCHCSKRWTILLGMAGIWIGVAIGHNLYYRWIFPEKIKSKA